MTNEELLLFTKKVASFKDALDENEAKILDLILAKAGELKPEALKDNASIASTASEVSQLSSSEKAVLGKLARSIDGVSNALSPGWLFRWTYRF